jgi:hypothetical protein
MKQETSLTIPLDKGLLNKWKRLKKKVKNSCKGIKVTSSYVLRRLISIAEENLIETNKKDNEQ